MSPDRIEWHLWNWEQWMQGKGDNGDYDSRASGGMGSSGSSDFDAMVANADARCAVAVEMVLEGLTQVERCAVHHVHLAAVYRFREPVDTIYARAKFAVGKGLTRRGIE